jgi:glycosyltransferase involved in cell wall biosynthesis
MPKLSVCVITYNQDLYIRDCLESIVTQVTNFEFEVIVGDDGSTDETAQIIREFVDRYPSVVTHVRHHPKVGGSQNFVDCHNRARGVYVAHMDGDDLMLPGKLQAQFNALESNKFITAVWHRMDFFDDSGKFCSGREADLSPFVNGIVTFDKAISIGFVGMHSSMMYRRNMRSTAPPGIEILDLYQVWDVLSLGDGQFLDQVLGQYRVKSRGSLTEEYKKIDTKSLAVDHARHYFKKFPDRRRSFFLFAISRSIYFAATRNRLALLYLKFAIETLSLVSPSAILRNLRDIYRIQVPWNRRVLTKGRQIWCPRYLRF